jgi:hypothetical protein
MGLFFVFLQIIPVFEQFLLFSVLYNYFKENE